MNEKPIFPITFSIFLSPSLFYIKFLMIVRSIRRTFFKASEVHLFLMHWQSLEFIMLVKLGILKFFFLFNNILDELSQDFKTDNGQCFRTVQKTMTVTAASSTGIFNHEKHMVSSSQSSVTIASKSGVSSSKSLISAVSAVNQLMNGDHRSLLSLPLD